MRHLAIERNETNMDNIIGGRSAVIQVTFLMEDRGFCKDVFATVEKPTRYYNRIFENYTGEVATWYSCLLYTSDAADD